MVKELVPRQPENGGRNNIYDNESHINRNGDLNNSEFNGVDNNDSTNLEPKSIDSNNKDNNSSNHDSDNINNDSSNNNNMNNDSNIESIDANTNNAENDASLNSGENDNGSVASQNSGGSEGSGESESDSVSGVFGDIGSDVETDESESKTFLEKIKGFFKNSLFNNPLSKGVKSAVDFGMDKLMGFGLTKKVAGVALATGSLLVVAVLGVSSAAFIAYDNITRDESVVRLHNCNDEDEKSKSATSKDEGDAAAFSNEQQKENVKKIYSVLKEAGLTDIEVAGAVANMQQESQINPKTIEAMPRATQSDYDKANKNGSTVENLFGSWDSFVALYRGGLDESGYLDGGKHWMGVGLIQWTGGSNKSLWEWSKANNYDMWSLDTQLIALLTPETGPYADRLKVFKTKDNGSPEKAAVNFLNYVEYAAGHFSPGDGTHAQAANRVRYAASWYVQIKEMSVDKDYSKSILDKVKISLKAASSKEKDRAKHEADQCGGNSKQKYGGQGWQAKGGVYSGNNGSYQAWRYDRLPEELKQYALDPRSLGMKYGEQTGWTTGASNYIQGGYADQCTALSSALLGLLWEKDGKPLGMNHGLSGNGYELVAQLCSRMGVTSRTEPVSGDLVSTNASHNHTVIVSHVFENGDILVVEQNVRGYSGQGNGESYSWSYRYITKSAYQAQQFTFASPESAGYKISPKAKSVG
jgi:conserved hypothetical secreted protein